MLNSFKSIYAALAVRAPHNGSMFQDRAHKGSVCFPFAVDWAVVYVTPKKAECGVCFFVTVGICECHLTSSGMVRPSMGCCLRVPGWYYSNCRRS